MGRVNRLTWMLALAGACGLAGAAERIAFTERGDFSEAAIRRGVEATKKQCDKVTGAVWASTSDHGAECIRFWIAGFGNGPTARAVVFFHGDVWVGEGKTSPRYLKSSIESVQNDADGWARRIKSPYIFVGRPGTHGSSGDHMQRRRIGESLLLSAALDRIRQHLQIGEFVVAGQSGGGHVTAALLTHRTDIVCAVPTSAPSSPRIRWEMKGLRRDTTGFADSYEPTGHLDRARMHRHLRVFVLGNPKETNVLWPSQEILATRLAQIGVPVNTLHGQGVGPDGHGLADSGRIVAGWCFHDLSTTEIVRSAAKGLRG